METLDTCEARPLTSREICKVISGAIVGGIQAGGVKPKVALELLGGFRDALRGETPASEMEETSSISIAWSGTVGGIVGALSGWCRPEDICTAIEWICEHWPELMTAAAVAGTSVRTGASA